MGKQIYYEIIHDCGVMSLYSVVDTSFGGEARSFVKHSPFASDLQEFAKSQGWKDIKFKENKQ